MPLHRACVAVAVLCLATLGCDEDEPATTPAPPDDVRPPDEAPAPAKPGAGSAELPRDAPASDAAKPLTEGAQPAGDPVGIECQGGEKRVSWRRFEKDGALVEAWLDFAAAGHRGWSYRFLYTDQGLIRARHEVRSWHFSGPQETSDQVLRRSYELTGTDAPACRMQRVEGPTEKVDALFEATESTPMPCRDAERVKELGVHAGKPSDAAPPWLQEVCEGDPSSGLKI